jgi:hypothetical protein
MRRGNPLIYSAACRCGGFIAPLAADGEGAAASDAGDRSAEHKLA